MPPANRRSISRGSRARKTRPKERGGSGSQSSPVDRRVFTVNPPPSSLNDFRKDKKKMVRSPTAKFVGKKSSFPSNHLMINEERRARSVPSLVRSCTLDDVARAIAARLAEHGTIDEGEMERIARPLYEASPSVTLGVNLGFGRTTLGAHHRFMGLVKASDNMLDRRYRQMGVGTSRSSDGAVILCQFFMSCEDKSNDELTQ